MKNMSRIGAAMRAACAVAIAAGVANAQQPADGVDFAANIIENDPLVVARALEEIGVSFGTVAKLDVPAQAQQFQTNIPIHGQVMTMSLQPYSIRADNFKRLVQLADGSLIEAEPRPVATVRGEILEVPGSIVAGSVLEDGFHGVIYLPGADGRAIAEDSTRLWAEPAGDGRLNHVLYDSRDVINQGGLCGSAEMFDPEINPEDLEGGVDRGSGNCGGICIAEIACDMDVEYGNGFGNAAGNIENVITMMSPQYENQVGITYMITAIVERSGDLNSDPYTSSAAGTLLNQFTGHWNATMGSIDRDVAQLFSGKNFDGTTIGLAPLGVICNISNAYNIVQRFGSLSCQTDLSAHELGHNWSSGHCNCPGNTMNPSITCANVFSQVTINQIVAHRNSRNCLDAFESGTSVLPFFDSFPTTQIDQGLWTGIDDVVSNGQGINEPSGTLSLNLEGDGEIRSARLDASLSNDLTLSFFYQRTGGGNSTETGEDLVTEYFNSSNNWVEIDRQLGSGPDMTVYEQVIVGLPGDAEHTELRIRFRNLSPTPGADDWFVDDASISGVAAIPGSFDLTTPSDGATGVGISPTFVWQASADATTYRLEVDNNNDFSSLELDFVTPSSFFSNPGVTFPNNTQYFWRVTAMNINGMTLSTTNPGTFTIGTVVADVCPGDCNGNGTVDFADLVAMLFQFGNDTDEGCNANGQGLVDFGDLVATLFFFGPCE